MAVSTRLVGFIGGHEGFVSRWYLDPVQVPTIGYGFTWNSKIFKEWWMAKYGRKMQRGDTISEADALEVLKRMIEMEYAPPVERKMPAAPVNVKEASTSATFNLGAGALAWKWAAAFARLDIKEGARLLRITGTTAKGKKLPGLVRRRSEEGDIAEFNRWPAWLGVPSSTEAPRTHITEDDVRLAQTILLGLGYQLGEADGIPGPRTMAAVRRFQTDHGTLKVDGIIGRATLTALVRTRDARTKGKVTTGSGTGGIVGGAAVEGSGAGKGVTIETPVTPPASGVDANIIGDILLWGGLALIVVGLAWLAWRYRDELPAIIRRLA